MECRRHDLAHEDLECAPEDIHYMAGRKEATLDTLKEIEQWIPEEMQQEEEESD